MTAGKGDISGWLVQRSPWPLLWGLVAVPGATAGHVARATSDGGTDDAIVVRAARAWPAGRSPCDDPRFSYPPSGARRRPRKPGRCRLRDLVPLAVTACPAACRACALRLHEGR